MRKPVVCIKPDLRLRARKRIVAQMATITTNIQVESTVFVTEDNSPLSANACGGIDRICGALCASMFAKIIDEIFELQEVSFLALDEDKLDLEISLCRHICFEIYMNTHFRYILHWF